MQVLYLIIRVLDSSIDIPLAFLGHVLSTGLQFFRLSYFGPGSGPTFLDNVQCTGSENNLLLCPSNAIGQENCNHNADAGVRCPGNRRGH